MADQPSPHVIVLGGGPVGLAAAAMLADVGHQVTVYEAKPDVPTRQASGYPLGVNARGQEAFRRIDPTLRDRLMDVGATVQGWRIYAGQRRVAELASGTVTAVTRGLVSDLLLGAAQQREAVSIITGHKLTGIDFDSLHLSFETESGDTVEVDASGSRVVAADGVWSETRRAMAQHFDDFQPQVGDWGVRFRVLFSQPGATAPGLDPYWHYIFGDKGVYSATLKEGIWTVSTTAVIGTEDEKLLLANDATPANERQLRRYIGAYAPMTAPLLRPQDYADFFTRDSFSGAVVRCPYLNVDEWLVLLGDAAHSVLPPTGEGLNSGLEDCCVLLDHITSGSTTPFADYNAARMPDLEALGTYAWTLMENIKSTDRARKTSNLILRIASGIGARFGIKGSRVEERLFGPNAGRTPYREIFAPWIAARERVYPKVYAVVRAGYDLAGRLRRTTR